MRFETLRKTFGLEEGCRPLTGFFFIQKLFYVHPGYGKKFESTHAIKYLAFYLIVGFPVYAGMLGHLLMATSDEILAERLESLAYAIEVVIQFSVVLTYIYLGNNFMSLFDRLFSNKFEIPEKLSQAFYKYNITALIFFVFACGVVSLLGIHNYHSNWYCDGRQLLNDKRFVCGLLSPAWYPFEVDSEMLKIVLFLWFWLFSLMVVPHTAMTIMGLILIPNYVKVKLEHLRNQLDEITSTDMDKLQRNFKYFVDYYSDIYESVLDINNTYGFCLACQFSLVTMIIALWEYNIIITGNHFEIIVLVSWLSLEALIDTIGQALEDEHEELVKSVCNLPWYDMPPELKKNYILFLGKVQMPVKLRAQPISDVNNEFLLSVLHGTYSMLMFLLNTIK